MKDIVTVKKAAKQSGPFFLKNSKGSHQVRAIHKVTARVYHVLCEDGQWYSLEPDYTVTRTP